MTAKGYLSQAYRLGQQINSKLAQVSRLRHMATQATGRFQAERISGTPLHSPMEDAVTKLIDLEYEINDDIDRLVDLKREMAAWIVKMRDPSCRLLLAMRYLDGNLWEEITLKLGYDLLRVHRLHGRALKEFTLVWMPSIASSGSKSKSGGTKDEHG